MNKEEFLKVLGEGLSALSRSERENIVSYYRGYIEDAGDEGEAIAQLGDPQAMAKRLISEMPDAPKREKSLGGRVWTVIVYVLASPFLLALGAVALALYICLWAAAFCLALALLLVAACPALVAVTLAAGGAFSLILGLAVGLGEWATLLLFTGGGLAMGALGLMILRPSVKLLLFSFKPIAAIGRWCIQVSAKPFGRRLNK